MNYQTLGPAVNLMLTLPIYIVNSALLEQFGVYVVTKKEREELK